MNFSVIIPFLYLLGIIPTMRMTYSHVRPWTEPLNCHHYPGCADGDHQHYGTRLEPGCYRRFADIDTRNEAVMCSALVAIIWPVAMMIRWMLIPVFRVLWLSVTGGHKPFPEEIAARTERYQQELASHDELDDL